MNGLRSLMSGVSLLVLLSAPVTAMAVFDTVPPATSAAVTGVTGSGGWYSSPVTVSLAAADDANGSGVAKTEYSLDKVTWQTYSAPFVLDSDGDQFVYFRSTDLAGNVEAPAKSQEIKINKSSLAGWWKMDGSWADASIFANNGTAFGATFSVDAKVGTRAGSFTPSSASYLSVKDSASLKVSTAMTLAAWIKAVDNNNYQQIISKFGGAGYGYQIGLAPGGRLRTDVSKDGTSYDTLVSPLSMITSATWQHVAVTFDNGLLTLYLNGVQVASKTTVSTLFPATTPLNIGRTPDCIQYFYGLIDEALVYNTALSATDIQDLYRRSAVRVPTVNPIPVATASPTITLSGTKPANTAIAVNGNTVVGVDGTTSWSTSYTLSQGTNSISVTARDAQNLSSLPVPLRIVLDALSPQVTKTIPLNNATLTSPPGAVSFTLADDLSPLNFSAIVSSAAVTNAAGGNVAGTWSSFGSGTTGTVTFTPASALSDGTYSCVIKPTDGSGNASTYALVFTIDSTAPVAPEITPVLAPISTTSKMISGTRSSDSAVVGVDCPGAAIGVVGYPTATTWNVYLTGLKEGSNVITVYAVDAAGNRSSNSTATVTVDMTPPTVTAAPAGGFYGSAQTAVLAANEPAAIYYTLDGSTPTVGAATYSQPIAITASATLKYFARDAAGNSSDIKTESYVIDTTSPVLVLSTLSDGAFTNNEILNVAGTATDDSAVKQVTVNDNAVPVNADGSFTYALVLTSGANTVTTVATDVIGNRSSETRTVTLDKTAPALVITTPADNSITGSPLLEVGGSVDENSRVVIKTGGAVQSAAQTGGTFSTYATLVPGYNTIEVTATDVAGNQSSLKRTILFDDQKPAVAIDAPSQDIRTNQSRVTVKGSVVDALTAVGVTISKDNEKFTPTIVDGSFEQTLNLTEEKSYDIVVTATNAVGASTTIQRNIIYDITPPVLGIDPVTAPISQPMLTVTGTREAGTTVTVTCATATLGKVAYPTATTWSVDASGLKEGENVVTAASIDAAGNAVTATATVVVATTPPSLTIAASPNLLWPPKHQMVPVTISGAVAAHGSAIKSVSISLRDEYRKIDYDNLTFGSTVMLEAWRDGNDADGRKYTITAVVTDMAGMTTTETTTVVVPHDSSSKAK